jgi:AcrR family transcriptional regulator
MRKGDITKEYIIKSSVPVFNQQGYFGASISDIVTATGIQRGGIYNHFKNKDDLALEAFDYAVNTMNEVYSNAIQGKDSAIEQLVSLISVYTNIIEDPPIAGGCPVLNTAIESDDAHPALRDRTRKAMDEWLRLIHSLLIKGIKKKEIKPSINVESVATFITSTFEGAVMLSKLYNDSTYMRNTIQHLTHFFNNDLKLNT